MIELDFQIRQGSYTLDARLSSTDQVTGLIGPSGSGKTTLLMALAGIIRPTGGLIGIKGGATFFDSGRGINLPIEKRRVGVVFQDDLLFLHLNVRENFLFGYNNRAQKASSAGNLSPPRSRIAPGAGYRGAFRRGGAPGRRGPGPSYISLSPASR